jgi:hypothetical protein
MQKWTKRAAISVAMLGFLLAAGVYVMAKSGRCNSGQCHLERHAADPLK